MLNLLSISRKHMDMITKKGNKLAAKISSNWEKQNYEKIHIPLYISL